MLSAQRESLMRYMFIEVYFDIMQQREENFSNFYMAYILDNTCAWMKGLLKICTCCAYDIRILIIYD